MKNKLTLAVMAALLTAGMSAAAHADTVTFTLTDPLQSISGQAGGTLTYEVTASAPLSNSDSINLVGDSANVGGTLTIDDTDYFLDAPFFLNPGDSDTFDLFTVTVLPGTTPGIYSGYFTVTGGAGSAVAPLGTVDFVTNVTPEPSSIVLLGSGLAGVVGMARRKRLM